MYLSLRNKQREYRLCSDLWPLLCKLFLSFFIRCGGSEKKKIDIPENGLWQEQLSLSPVFMTINDLFEEAPSQHGRITSKPYVCNMLTPSQNSLLSCRAVMFVVRKKAHGKSNLKMCCERKIVERDWQGCVMMMMKILLLRLAY